MRLITADQAAELDQKAMQDHGISGVDLMGAAGKVIAEKAKSLTVEIHNPRIVIFAGKEIMAVMDLPQQIILKICPFKYLVLLRKIV